MSNIERERTHHIRRIADSLETLVRMIEESESTAEGAGEVPTEFDDAR